MAGIGAVYGDIISLEGGGLDYWTGIVCGSVCTVDCYRKVRILDNLSRVVRKPAFCICENKDADQLRSNCAADQRLCFRYTDSTIPLLPISEISSLQPSCMAVQPGLCRTWSETPKTGFLRTRLAVGSVSRLRRFDSRVRHLSLVKG